MIPPEVRKNVGHAAECSPRAASTARRIAICDARDGEEDEHEKFGGERSGSRGAWLCGCRTPGKPGGIKKKSTATSALGTENEGQAECGGGTAEEVTGIFFRTAVR
jgi:hypothetical protein